MSDMPAFWSAADVAAAIDRIDDMLRDLGTPVNTGACQCSRCRRALSHHGDAPAELACEPDTADLPGGALVTNPHPLPVRPPGGIKQVHMDGPRGGFAGVRFQRVADEISF